MAGRRRKKRTHVIQETEDGNPVTAALSNIPKSFVIRTGNLTRVASLLVADLRCVMEPNTASRLRERKRNKLRDYVAVAGQLGVSHFMMVSQTETSTNLRLAKFPKGPTCSFRLDAYTLAREIVALQPKGKVPHLEYTTPPLLVLNNFEVNTSHGKLLCSMLQGMFPAVNTARVKLASVRRVALFHHDRERGCIEFRHYAITVKMTGVSKSIRRLVQAQIPDLGQVADIGDYVLGQAGGAASESEMEPDSMVTLGQDYHGAGNVKASQRAVHLVEIGPRVSMTLTGIQEGFCAGATLYPTKPT